MRIVRLCTFLVLLCGFSAGAAAQELSAADEEKFTALSAEAGEHYQAGNLEQAIGAFEAAYALKPVANILYNVARIHEKAGNIDAAIENYEKFVVAPGVEQGPRQDALDRLKTLKEVKAIQDGEKDPPDTDPDPDPDPDPAPEAKPDRTLAWVLLGVGLPTLAAGGVFAILTNNESSKFEDAMTLEARRKAASNGETYAIVADSLVAVGAIATILGTIFYFTASPSESETAFNFTPTFDGRAVGAAFTFDF